MAETVPAHAYGLFYPVGHKARRRVFGLFDLPDPRVAPGHGPDGKFGAKHVFASGGLGIVSADFIASLGISFGIVIPVIVIFPGLEDAASRPIVRREDCRTRLVPYDSYLLAGAELLARIKGITRSEEMRFHCTQRVFYKNGDTLMDPTQVFEGHPLGCPLFPVICPCQGVICCRSRSQWC